LVADKETTMADPKTPGAETSDNTPHFETDEVAATRGREQGLGVGARELAAQRDAGDVQSRDDENAKMDDEEAADPT
jgi:hypothetical protein